MPCPVRAAGVRATRRPRASIVRGMELATEELLDRFAAVLTDLADRHGLSNLRQADRGAVVADVAPGRTYLDLADFELEAESVLGAALFVIPSGSPHGRDVAGRPLRASIAA